MGYRQSITFETQMRRNIESAIAVINVTESALGSATESVQRIRELAVQAANDVLGPSERSGIADEVDQLIRQLVQDSNTQFGGQHVFSGQQTQAAAFTVTGDPPTAVTYQGDTGERVRRISSADTVSVNVPGSQVFGQTFTDLIAFRDALRANGPIQDIQGGIGAMDSALDRILTARSDLGARTVRLEATVDHSFDVDLDLQQLRSSIEDLDLAEGIVSLNAQQNALQATLGAIGRTSTVSLLDFLR
jgi:flagellar hook-associated protein 3 FlgL